MSQRLLLVKWTFRIDIETCQHCGGAVKIIASVEDPVVILNTSRSLEIDTLEPSPSGDSHQQGRLSFLFAESV